MMHKFNESDDDSYWRKKEASRQATATYGCSMGLIALILAAIWLLCSGCGASKMPSGPKLDFYGREIRPDDRIQGEHDTCTRHQEVSHKDGRCFFCGEH